MAVDTEALQKDFSFLFKWLKRSVIQVNCNWNW